MNQLPDERNGKDRKRSIWRGILAGFIAHLIGTIVVAIFYLVVQYIWRDASGTSHGRSGAIDANSGEWLALQCAASAIAFFAGAATAKWSPPKSWIAAGLYIFIQSMCSIFAQLPNTDVLWRQALWTLTGPLFAWAGAWWMKRRSTI